MVEGSELSDDAKVVYGATIECGLLMQLEDRTLVIDPIQTKMTERFQTALGELVAKGYLSETINMEGLKVYTGLQDDTGLGRWVLDNRGKADWPLFERLDWQECDRGLQ